MSYLGRRGATAPLNSADIPDDVVQGTDIAYLENDSTTQNLGGTYSTERMYLNDSYTLNDDVTVTNHLALGSIADSDVVITQDSTERTITGSGTLEAGRLMNDPQRTSVTGMTGELGSAVTGSPAITGVGTVTSGDISAIQDGWIHILTKTNTTSNSINITQADNATVFSSTYPLYMITMTNFSSLSASGQLYMRMEYNGAFPTTGYRHHVQGQRSTPGDYVAINATNSSYIPISTQGSRAQTYMQGSMIMYMNDPNIVSRQGCWWQFSHHMSSSGHSIKDDGVGGYDPSSYAITGLQFAIDASSVTWNGTFKVFGLKG